MKRYRPTQLQHTGIAMLGGFGVLGGLQTGSSNTGRIESLVL